MSHQPYSFVGQKVDAPGQMHGPVLDTIHSHHFREIISSALAMADFVSPKYADFEMLHNNYMPEAPVVHQIKG